MRFRAVFFDAGETLLAPHPSFHELFAAVVGERGHRVEAAEVERAREAVAPTFLEVLDGLETPAWSTSKEVSRRFWGKVYGVVFRELGIPDPDGELAGALYERFTRYESYRLFPDAVATLRSIKRAGIATGLISNFEEWLEGMLAHMEIAPLLDSIVISGKEGIEKPDPAIFRLALERTGVAAHESVYVGDHPEIDVAGSAAVGMTGVLIDRRGRHRDYGGPRIESLTELLPVLGIDGA